MKKKHLCSFITLGLILTPITALSAGIGPHNASNLFGSAPIDFPDGSSTSSPSTCANCHYSNYVSRCKTCHTNTSGGGYSNMSNWDNSHGFVTDSAPAVMTHRDLACGDCHWAVTHTSMADYLTNKLISGTFASSSVGNTLLGTHTWTPDPERWTDSNGDPGTGRVQEQWTSTITIPAGFTVDHPDWANPSLWMEKTGPERGLILGVINSSGSFDGEDGTFEVMNASVNGDSSVMLTVKGKIVLSALYNVDQTTPAFALYYHQMMKYAIGYCDDPDQPGSQIDTVNPQICFQNMGGNPWTADSGFPYGSSNCPQDVECIHQDVRFAGPTDFAKTDDSGTGGIDSTPDGICQVCHLSTNHWRRDGSLDDNHYSEQKCTDCHEHTNGFKPNCVMCHAEPPIDQSGMVYSTDGINTTPDVTGSTLVGAHALHASPSGYNYSCDSCHQGGMPDSSYMGNNKIQIGFSVNPADTVSTYDGQVGGTFTGPFAYEGTGNTVVNTGGTLVCSNIYCHGNGSTVSTDRVNNNTTPAWNSTTPLTCDSCHPHPVMSYEANDFRQDTHGRHAQIGYSSCELCHFETTTDGATINDRSKHANRAYDVSPGPTFIGRAVEGVQSLDFTYNFAKNGGTCSSNSCHAYWGYSETSQWGYTSDFTVIPYISGTSSTDVSNVVTLDASRSSCYAKVDGFEDFGKVIEERSCSYDWDFGGAGNVVGGNGKDIIIYEYSIPAFSDRQFAVSLTMTQETSGTSATASIDVTAKEVITTSHSVDFATMIDENTLTLTVASLPLDIKRAYIYWGDRQRTVSTDPQADLVNGLTHTYTPGSNNYSMRVTTLDTDHNKLQYSLNEDADLSVTIP